MKKLCPQCNQKTLVFEEFEIICLVKEFEFNDKGKIDRNNCKRRLSSETVWRKHVCKNCGYNEKPKNVSKE